jgi:hypothetical protein
MADYMSIHIDRSVVRKSKEGNLIEQHPSGFTVEIDNDPTSYFKGRIQSLWFDRKEFSVTIYPDCCEDPKAERCKDDLPKLYKFFSNVDPSLIGRFMEEMNCFNFHYGRYNNSPDFSSQTDEHLAKYKNWPYLLLSDWGFNCCGICFRVKELIEKLKAAGIDTEPNGEDEDTIIFLKDVEEETLKKTFENIINLMKISGEILMAEGCAAQKYGEEKKPWELIK